jgi:hypothetical protein
MSTRASIFYGEGIHLYVETFSDDVCLELERSFFDDDGGIKEAKTNPMYGDIVLSRKALEELCRSLGAYLAKNQEDLRKDFSMETEHLLKLLKNVKPEYQHIFVSGALRSVYAEGFRDARGEK